MNLFETTAAAAGLKITAAMVTAPDSPISVRTRWQLRKLELKAGAVYSRDELVAALEAADFSRSDRLSVLMELDQAHRRGALRIEDWPAQPGVPNGLPFGPRVDRPASVFRAAAATEEEAYRQLPR
jgi:hypothetical protein